MTHNLSPSGIREYPELTSRGRLTALLRNMYATSLFGGLLASLQDVLFPPRCLGCGDRIDAADVLCPVCLASLLPLEMDAESLRTHLSSLTFPSEATMMLVGFEHEAGGALEACIHAMKYQGMHRIGVWLGRLLGEHILGSPLLGGDPLVVPVPLHKVKQLERGYNQAEMLCRGLAMECELDHVPKLLARRRYTISQSAARLHRDQRRGNMLDAFMVDAAQTEAHRHRPVIIVDDLVTTGATMGECSMALHSAGFRDIRFLALSRPFAGGSGERRAESGERRAESGEQRAESRERRAESGERRAESRERRAESGERRAESGERRAESGEQRAESGERRVLISNEPRY